MSEETNESGGLRPDLTSLSAEAYEDLRKLAKARLRSSGPFTLLDTAGLVSDTYKRLAERMRELQESGYERFLVGCRDESWPEFEPYLHPYVRQRFVGHFAIEPATATMRLPQRRR